MGNAAFPKRISQGRRLLRSSSQQRGARQPGCASVGMCHTCWHRQGIAKPSSSPGRNLWWSQHCREWDAQPEPPSLHVPAGERETPGRALMGGRQEQLWALLGE